MEQWNMNVEPGFSVEQAGGTVEHGVGGRCSRGRAGVFRAAVGTEADSPR